MLLWKEMMDLGFKSWNQRGEKIGEERASGWEDTLPMYMDILPPTPTHNPQHLLVDSTSAAFGRSLFVEPVFRLLSIIKFFLLPAGTDFRC